MASQKATFGGRLRSWLRTAMSASRPGGGTAVPDPSEPRARKVVVRRDRIVIELDSGAMISAPLERFPRLIEASERERNHFELIGGGSLIHWPDVDEDVDVAALARYS